jgi:cold shock CspA family protein
MRGVVEFFDERRGFGRISPAEGSATVFCHFSSISDKDEKVLIQGEEVEFNCEEGDRGPVARDVRRVEQRNTGTVKVFDKGFGWITPVDGSPDIFVHFSDITGTGFKRLEVGEKVSYAVGETEHGKKATRVRRLDTRAPLERFALLPEFEDKLKQLAEELAHKENWGYRHTKSSRPYPVLCSYIYYTFARLEAEEKIAETRGDKGRQIACINTGLATERQEAIFALFTQNMKSAPDAPQWTLESFNKDSDRALTHFARRPDLPNYFTEPSELLYDTRIDLVVDIDHVIGDNRDRFPAEIQNNDFAIRSALDGAVSAAKRRVRRNYKTAIPQFHMGRLQLLLPLCMVQPDRADLALVAARENQVYRASTVLTLDMAYNNARLVARPDTEWLDP